MAAPAHLGIDFGTSHTVAVLRRADGRVEALMFDGTSLLTSGVAAGRDGVLTVGADAAHSARTDPASFEPHPKRRIDDGTVLLGEHEFAVEDLFAAVLAEVRARCAEVARAVPETVTLTHPAAWGPRRRRILRSAAAKAGFPEARLLPEPVAAAAYYTRELGHEVPVGAAVVVHDFGGGTFDAAVVRRTEEGFKVLAVDGLDDLGGVDVDEALLQHVRSQYADPGVWERLLGPSTSADRRNARILREDVRSAKELLSGRTTAELHIPVLDRDVHVTRGELERITTPLLARAVEVTSAVVEESGVPADGITGVFLVGGGSRMPLAATLLHRELGRAPVIADHIEQVVAHGAILDGEAAPAPAPNPAPAPRPPVTPKPKPAPKPPIAVARPEPAPPRLLLGRPLVLWILAGLLVLEVIGAVPPLFDDAGPPGLAETAAGLVVLSLAAFWPRIPLARLTLMTAQFAFAATQVPGMFAGAPGPGRILLGAVFAAAGVVGTELAAVRVSADWYRVPPAALRPNIVLPRRMLASLGTVGFMLTALLNQPSTGETDARTLELISTFNLQTTYVDLAMDDTGGVAARVDGMIDVFSPASAVPENFEVASGRPTAVALSEVDGERVAVVGYPGSAHVVALDDGRELCTVEAPGQFADLATAIVDSSPALVSGSDGTLGVWKIGDCSRHAQFDEVGDTSGELAVAGLSAGPAALFGEDTGVAGGVDLHTGSPSGQGIPLSGRPDLAVTRVGELVTALGTRVSAWNLADGTEKHGVELDAAVHDGAFAVLRHGERLLAATADVSGTLRVCDLASGEEVGEYELGVTASGPLLGFTNDGEPRLTVVLGSSVSVFGL